MKIKKGRAWVVGELTEETGGGVELIVYDNGIEQGSARFLTDEIPELISSLFEASGVEYFSGEDIEDAIAELKKEDEERNRPVIRQSVLLPSPLPWLCEDCDYLTGNSCDAGGCDILFREYDPFVQCLSCGRDPCDRWMRFVEQGQKEDCGLYVDIEELP